MMNGGPAGTGVRIDVSDADPPESAERYGVGTSISISGT